MQPITLLITDDHAQVRKVLTLLLNSDSRFQVIGECKDGEEAIEKEQALHPTIILMDINLPGISGYETCAAILQNNPAAKILGMSMNAEPHYAIRMIQDGAMGYVTKNSPQEEIFEALVEIYNNRKYVSRDIKNKLQASLHAATIELKEKKQLTSQEIEIIIYIRLGLTPVEISEKPGFTKEMMDSQLLQVLYKLDLPDVASLRTFPAY